MVHWAIKLSTLCPGCRAWQCKDMQSNINVLASLLALQQPLAYICTWAVVPELLSHMYLYRPTFRSKRQGAVHGKS
jgi:hypothetical protein